MDNGFRSVRITIRNIFFWVIADRLELIGKSLYLSYNLPDINPIANFGK